MGADKLQFYEFLRHIRNIVQSDLKAKLLLLKEADKSPSIYKTEFENFDTGLCKK